MTDEATFMASPERGRIIGPAGIAYDATGAKAILDSLKELLLANFQAPWLPPREGLVQRRTHLLEAMETMGWLND